jgi:hypothetical protein
MRRVITHSLRHSGSGGEENPLPPHGATWPYITSSGPSFFSRASLLGPKGYAHGPVRGEPSCPWR